MKREVIFCGSKMKKSDNDFKTQKINFMRNDNTFGIHFILRMNKVKDDKAPIYARIVVNGSRCEISLKKKVELKDWNQSKGLAKSKSNDLKSLNNYLEEVRGQFADCYRHLHLLYE